jgi:sec-independent protein translocase protein TatA
MVGLGNPLHLVFLLLIVLLVFGAKRLPEMGRSLGSGLRGFKDAISGDTQHAIVSETETEPTPELTPAVDLPGAHAETAILADELEARPAA